MHIPAGKNLFAIAVVSLLSACAGFGAPPPGNSPEQLLSEARGPEENRKLHTDLIREMIAQDRLYAAYAHLQAQEKNFGDNQELKLLRAEIQRKLGRNEEAEAVYKTLLDTPYAGYAQHGLGLIYATRDIDRGTRYLRKAVASRPTDARIRNDLGYALIRQKNYEEARLHLATAFQLSSGSELSRNNYILILLLDGDEAAVRRIAAQARIPEAEMAALRAQASELRSRPQATAVTTRELDESLTVGSGGG